MYLEYFFDIRVDQLIVLTISTIDSPSTDYQRILRLWLWYRFKSLSLPSWNSSQLDVSGQRRSQVRPSHPAPSDNGLTRIDGLKNCEKVETWNPKNLISEDEVKKLKLLPYRLLPSGKMGIYLDTKSKKQN